MKSKGGFTKKDFIVILGCAVFALANLGAIGSSGRRRAKEFVCLSNLLQWGTIFQMYCDDNNGYFFSGELSSGTDPGMGNYWRVIMKPYSRNVKMWLCPQATKPLAVGTIPTGEQPWVAWQAPGEVGNDVGSYGFNGWALNLVLTPPSWARLPASNYWRTYQVKGASNVPVFTDMWFVDAWPLERDRPPPKETGPADTIGTDEMNRVCVNRHEGYVNGLFMDFSARSIGLKELWTLKWHRSYNVNGPWTKAGGVRLGDWPEWMRDFPEY